MLRSADARISISRCGAGPGIRRTAAAVLAVACVTVHQAPAADAPRPPAAERRPVSVEHHGITLTDDYAWLRTARLEELLERPEVLEPEIRAHLEAESRYAEAMLAPNRALERRLVAEMRARISPRDATVPEAWGPWEYYSRYEGGRQRRMHCRRPRGGGPEQVLLDENVLARGRPAYSVSEFAVSHDHKLLAYSVDEDGSERNTLRIRDLATGRDLPDAIAEVRGGAVWSLDSRWLFYVGRDPTKWGRKVFRHRLGTAAAEDQLVYEETEEGFAVSLRSTLSDRFLVIEAADFTTSDVRLVELAHPTQPPLPVVERKRGHKYQVANLGDRLIFVTNANGAIDWKIGERPLSAPANAPLLEIVPHVPGRVIEDVVVYRDHLVWQERDRESGSQRIVVRRWSDGTEHAIGFGPAPAKVDLVAGLEQGTRTLRFSYQTMAQPRQVFDYDMETRRRTLRKVQEVPGGHDPARYVTRRLSAPAEDGAGIPVTLLYRKDLGLDGSTPVWLYGYGAYGDRDSPEFGTERLSLVDRGFIYAVAHVRGSGEKGDAWHDAGRLANKANSFTDFIAVAEHLVRLRLTRPGRIAASGASAGGTLVGAAVNLRPDLFGAVYAEVPFVDALNTLLDRSLPLTESSFSEFGNPGASKADFLNIKAYAPYENVRAQAYPPMLVYQSLNDARVPYWEAAKWVAKLRQLKTSGNPVILFIKMSGGHSSAAGRFDALQDYARAYAFGIGTLIGSQAPRLWR
jgi:oligopeptidase B